MEVLETCVCFCFIGFNYVVCLICKICIILLLVRYLTVCFNITVTQMKKKKRMLN